MQTYEFPLIIVPFHPPWGEENLWTQNLVDKSSGISMKSMEPNDPLCVTGPPAEISAPIIGCLRCSTVELYTKIMKA